jgi:hypothetical protein
MDAEGAEVTQKTQKKPKTIEVFYSDLLEIFL